MKSWGQISVTGGSQAQGDGESGIHQLKKTPRVFQTWDGFLGFLEQLVPKGLICSANAWLRKHWSCIALGLCTTCWCLPNMTWCLCSYDIVCPHRSWTMAWSLLLCRLCLTNHCCSWGAITRSIRWDGSVFGAPGSVSYLCAPLPCLPAPEVSGAPVKLAVTDTYCRHPGIAYHSRTTGTCLKIVLFTCTFPSNPSFSWYCLMWSKPLPITYSLSTLSLVGSDESPSLLFWACRSPRHKTVPAQWWQLNYNNFSASFAAQIQYLWHY